MALPASHTSNITRHVVGSVSDDIMPSYSLFPTSSHQKSGVDLNLATGSTKKVRGTLVTGLEGRWETHGLYGNRISCHLMVQYHAITSYAPRQLRLHKLCVVLTNHFASRLSLRQRIQSNLSPRAYHWDRPAVHIQQRSINLLTDLY